MSVQTVSVTVPTSGLGPASSIATLVGQKTVILSGQFSGYYDLLASQDGSNFAGVASFSAGGVESIKQTIPGAFSSLRLRSNGSASGPVTCEVSGVVGQNYFTTIASLPTGFSGYSPVIDTYALFPPTGVEQDVCFICVGGFRGSVVLLGSLDGIQYNAIGSFRVDRLPEGSAERLTFPVLASLDKVRYVKVQVLGQVTSPLSLTMGGSVPTSAVVNESSVSIIAGQSTQYYVKGELSSDSPLSDDDGNAVSLPNTDVTCLGTRNTVGPSYAPDPSYDNPIVVVGTSNSATGSSLVPLIPTGHLLLAGDGNSVGQDSVDCIACGSSNQLGAISNNEVVVGKQNQISGPSDTIVTIGSENQITANASVVSVIGALNTVGVTAQNVQCVGNSNTFGAREFSCTIVGVGNTISDDDTFIQVVGTSNNVAQNASVCSVVGRANLVSAGASSIALVADNSQARDDSSNVVILGTSVLIGSRSAYCLGFGNNNSIGDDSFFCQVRGLAATIANDCGIVEASGYLVGVGAFVQETQALGSQITVGASCSVLTVLGKAITVGASTTESIVVGSDNTLNTGASRSVVSGFHIDVLSGDPGHAAAFCVASGSTIQVGLLSKDTVAIGHDVTVGASTTDVYALGNQLVIRESCSGILAVGTSTQVGAVGGPGINDVNTFGRSNDLSLCAGTTNVFGSHATFGAACQGHVLGNFAAFQSSIGVNTYGIAIGTSVTILSTGQIWAIGIGFNVTAGPGQCIIGDSDNTTDPLPQIHYFAVRGYNGAALDTIRAVDNPASDGETGLTVVFNSAGAFSNKTLKAAVAPPGGSLLAYFDP